MFATNAIAAAIEAVAAELGWKTSAVELVAVVRGPGSFTGLRVGVTTAKALCWATGSRLLGVSSCEVIARGTATALVQHDAPVTVAYDAGRGEVFAALVMPDEHSPTGWRTEAGRLVAADDWLAGMAPGSIVTGPGLTLLTDALADRPDLVVAPSSEWMPAVAEIGRIATPGFPRWRVGLAWESPDSLARIRGSPRGRPGHRSEPQAPPRRRSTMRTGVTEEPPKRAEVFGPTPVAAPLRRPKPAANTAAFDCPVADSKAR